MARNLLIPDPLYSDREYERFYHYDITNMETGDLLCELCSTRCQLWLLKSGRFAHMIGFFEQSRRVEWLSGRISRIEVELSKRRYVTREARSQPKPKLAEGVRL
jgi:hypothetical protein